MFLVVGSRDCRISIWSVAEWQYSIHKILYGHFAEVEQLKISNSLQIIVSIDKDNVCNIYSTLSLDLVTTFTVEIAQTDCIDCIFIQENGFIFCLTQR